MCQNDGDLEQPSGTGDCLIAQTIVSNLQRRIREGRTLKAFEYDLATDDQSLS